MTEDWTPLDRELDAWDKAGMTLPLWWRDDDAVADTPALRQLDALSTETGLPVHLAVIPAGADAALGALVAAHTHLIPLVHGRAHENHAPEGQKKAEFGPHRPPAEMKADIAWGLSRLSDLFGPRLRPVFVPPWNRIAPELVAGLAGLGFAALSAFAPRKTALAAPGLARINTHLDPIDWRGTRSLVAPDRLIAQMALQLADRRSGYADNDEPYGLLTHHLAHDGAIWDFTARLLSRLRNGPTRAWSFDDLPPAKDTT